VNSTLKFCEEYIYGKQNPNIFIENGNKRAMHILKLVHRNFNGQMKTSIHGGTKYFFFFIDDFIRKTFRHFLMQKSQVVERFKEFKAFVKNKMVSQI